jgi:hypothetical protein
VIEHSQISYKNNNHQIALFYPLHIQWLFQLYSFHKVNVICVSNSKKYTLQIINYHRLNILYVHHIFQLTNIGSVQQQAYFYVLKCKHQEQLYVCTGSTATHNHAFVSPICIIVSSIRNADTLLHG